MGNVHYRIHNKGGDKMISKIRRSMAGNEGFTLIELMIVVAIIGILAAVAVPNFVAYRDRSRQAAVIATGEGMRSAMAALAASADNSTYPAEKPSNDDLKGAGFTLPTGYTFTYAYVADDESYSIVLTGNSKCATVTPNSVTKVACGAE
jgi:prepilin-type N-terminal cleavage/methylation domain-containing protein